MVRGGWWLAVGGWRQLAVVGSWRLVAAGSWRRLVAGGWWLAVGGWQLVVGGWWRLAVDGSWRLAVGGPLGRSLRAVLSKKKKSRPLRTPWVKEGVQTGTMARHNTPNGQKCGDTHSPFRSTGHKRNTVPVPGTGRSLTRKKKVFLNDSFAKRPRVAVGGWWRLAVGGWRRLAVGGWWRLVVGGGWWLAVGGPLGRSLRAVLDKKKLLVP